MQTCHSHRRSRLAGEEALGPCTNLATAFAGKPAPTADARKRRTPCTNRLAGERALGPCAKLATAFAGKPAPTADARKRRTPVGAGLPAKRPSGLVQILRSPSLASQLLQSQLLQSQRLQSQLLQKASAYKASSYKTPAPTRPGGYQKRCWVRRLHQVSSTRSMEPLAASPTRSCRLLRSA